MLISNPFKISVSAEKLQEECLYLTDGQIAQDCDIPTKLTRKLWILQKNRNLCIRNHEFCFYKINKYFRQDLQRLETAPAKTHTTKRKGFHPCPAAMAGYRFVILTVLLHKDHYLSYHSDIHF